MITIPLTTGSRRQTLAQVLMTFYTLVTMVNDYNKKHRNGHFTIEEDVLGDLHKEMRRISTRNDYMNAHLHMHIDEMNDKLNERNYIAWLEDFIYEFIHHRDDTIFLTYDNWETIHNALFESDAKLLTPFRDIHVSVIGTNLKHKQ